MICDHDHHWIMVGTEFITPCIILITIPSFVRPYFHLWDFPNAYIVINFTKIILIYHLTNFPKIYICTRSYFHYSKFFLNIYFAENWTHSSILWLLSVWKNHKLEMNFINEVLNIISQNVRDLFLTPLHWFQLSTCNTKSVESHQWS